MDVPVTTTEAGIAASRDEHSLTVGPDGPILLQDHYLLQKKAHFNRERIPERVVHAKGGGAHGFFEATHDISDWCRAGFLRKGTRHPGRPNRKRPQTLTATPPDAHNGPLPRLRSLVNP